MARETAGNARSVRNAIVATARSPLASVVMGDDDAREDAQPVEALGVLLLREVSRRRFVVSYDCLGHGGIHSPCPGEGAMFVHRSLFAVGRWSNAMCSSRAAAVPVWASLPGCLPPHLARAHVNPQSRRRHAGDAWRRSLVSRRSWGALRRGTLPQEGGLAVAPGRLRALVASGRFTWPAAVAPKGHCQIERPGASRGVRVGGRESGRAAV